MTLIFVEPSGENPALARAEIAGAAEAVGGRVVPAVDAAGEPDLVAVELARPAIGIELAGRLALARRCLEPLAGRRGDDSWATATLAESPGASASIRPLGRPTGGDAASVAALAGAWKAAGGTVDLRHPQVRIWYRADRAGALRLYRETGTVPRSGFRSRRMPTLPFRRPVSLPPPLARVAVNLAAVRPGERVVDPFLGTGALLAEAALVGAEVGGGDVDAEMVRGALRNFEHLGLQAQLVKVADAGVPFAPPGVGLWDAIITDPPYGRASGTRGEDPSALVLRALTAWAEMARPLARLSLVAPSQLGRAIGPAWSLEVAVAHRVHRSLTREFRVYRRVSSPSTS